MSKYNNGKIYKIESHLGDLIYVGSTSKKNLNDRLLNHKQDYRNFKNGLNKTITSFKLFELYGIDTCRITLIEEVKCETKEQLLTREAFYIKSLSCVNKIIPLRTDKEYYQDNKEKVLQRKKIHYEKNKERLNKIHTCDVCCGTYLSRNKNSHFRTNKHLEALKLKLVQNDEGQLKEQIEKIEKDKENKKDKVEASQKLYYENNKHKRKIYKENNRDKLNALQKLYYEKNKEKINAQLTCDVCNGCYSRGSKSSHMKTKMHINASIKPNENQINESFETLITISN